MLTIRPAPARDEIVARAGAYSRRARSISTPASRSAASIAASYSRACRCPCGTARRSAMPSRARPGEARRVGLVARRPARPRSGQSRALRPAIRASAAMFDAAARDQDARRCARLSAWHASRVQSLARAPGLGAARARCSRARRPRSAPIAKHRLARRLELGGDRVRLVRPRRPPTMPMPQLKVRAISSGSILPCACRKAISRGCSQASASITRVAAVGQHARDILEQPAAGDVRQRLDPARAHQRQQASSRRCASAPSARRSAARPDRTAPGDRASSPCPRPAGAPARSRSNARPTRRGRA